MLRCSRMFYHLKSASEVVRKVAVIGSGPTGLTLVRNLLNSNIPALQVDLIERLHVPYGLLRYGVSPDHQDIKDAEKRLDQKIDTYHKRYSHPYGFVQKYRFIGNTNITDTKSNHEGETIQSNPGEFSLEKLSKCYDLVAITSGAGDKSRKLDIPGEDSPHVFTSLEISGWYNSHPYYIKNGKFDLENKQTDLSEVKNVVIIGLGNVALDVGRILAMNAESTWLSYSDCDKQAYESLKKSQVENIFVVGRKGPKHFKGTRKELKEIRERTSDKTTVSVLDDGGENFESESIFADEKEFKNMKKAQRKDLSKRGQFRTYAYLRDFSRTDISDPLPEHSRDRNLQFRFYREPIEITRDSVKFRINGCDDQIEEVPADMVILCTGNELSGWDGLIDYSNGKVQTEMVTKTVKIGKTIVDKPETSENTKKTEASEEQPEFKDVSYKYIVPGFENVCIAGWARYGSAGIINSSVDEANYLGNMMQHRLLNCVDPQNREKELSTDFEEWLSSDTVYKSSWEDWVQVREYEKDCAYEEGRYRNKVLNAADLVEKLEIIKNLTEKIPEDLPEL